MIIRICIAVQLWLLDVSLPPSTIRYLDASLPDGSPPGRFATWTSRTFGCFDTRTFRYLLGRFATCLKACNLYCINFSKSFPIFNTRGLLSPTVSLSMYATALQTASVFCTNLNEQHVQRFATETPY